jgi:hypothetical protein
VPIGLEREFKAWWIWFSMKAYTYTRMAMAKERRRHPGEQAEEAAAHEALVEMVAGGTTNCWRSSSRWALCPPRTSFWVCVKP